MSEDDGDDAGNEGFSKHPEIIPIVISNSIFLTYDLFYL
jgi:hypothetical protein